MQKDRFINIEEEIAALAYFVPDFKDNPESAAIIAEICKAAGEKAALSETGKPMLSSPLL